MQGDEGVTAYFLCMVPGSGFSPGATAMKEPMSIFKELIFHGGGDRQKTDS